jgi:hypothetical protein
VSKKRLKNFPMRKKAYILHLIPDTLNPTYIKQNIKGEKCARKRVCKLSYNQGF